MEEICVSGPIMVALTPIFAAVAAVAGAIGVLYRDVVKSRDSHILYLTQELSEAYTRLDAAAPLMKQAESEVRRARGR